MIGFWDVIGRSESGALLREEKFDLQVGRVAHQMVEKASGTTRNRSSRPTTIWRIGCTRQDSICSWNWASTAGTPAA